MRNRIRLLSKRKFYNKSNVIFATFHFSVMTIFENTILSVLFLLPAATGNAQMKYYANPLKIPVSISGNFGEMRTNHFHTGLDFRTLQKTRLPVYSASDGFVSRIVVSPTGYGRALYIDHPNGTVTLYGHLDRFRKDLEDYVKASQYKQQTFAVDLKVPHDKFKVKRGEEIAKSGNTGSSEGPHLHFEIREVKSQDAFNPLIMNDFKIADRTPPRISALRVYPLNDQSYVNSGNGKRTFPLVSGGKHYTLQQAAAIRAYGEIGFSVNARDYIDNSANTYGIYSSKLFINGENTFTCTFGKINFDQNRYINSYLDYEEFVKSGIRYQKLWRDRGSYLFNYETDRSRGILKVDSGKTYECVVQLQDAAGNIAKLTFKIEGKFTREPPGKKEQGRIFHYDSKNRISSDNFEINAPNGAFYEDFPFTWSASEKEPGYYSALYKVNENTVPVHKPLEIILLTTGVPQKLREKVFVAGISEKGRKFYAGGKLSGDRIKTTITEFGNYGVVCDTVPPGILPLTIKNNALTDTNSIQFRIYDDLSGIKSYTGWIDGQWVLFEYDPKRSLLFYRIDPERLTLKKRHTLNLVVKDRVNNTTVYKATFWK